MNHHGQAKFEYEIDFRTGVTTAIRGSDVSEDIRAACITLNSSRARGIIEIREETQRREPISSHVWRDSFTGRLDDWEIPLISLESLGIKLDNDGILEPSKGLMALTPGAEAAPFLDVENQVVYKLFDLRYDGSLGKKLHLKKLSANDGYDLVQ